MTSRKKLNIAMIGHGFMGRAHSNAIHQVGHFFDVPYELCLKVICGRDRSNLEAMASQWGWKETAGGQANLSGFEIQRSVDWGGWQKVAELRSDQSRYSERLPAGAHVTYRVRSLGRTAPSAWSNPAWVDVVTLSR